MENKFLISNNNTFITKVDIENINDLYQITVVPENINVIDMYLLNNGYFIFRVTGVLPDSEIKFQAQLVCLLSNDNTWMISKIQNFEISGDVIARYNYAVTGTKVKFQYIMELLLIECEKAIQNFETQKMQVKQFLNQALGRSFRSDDKTIKPKYLVDFNGFNLEVFPTSADLSFVIESTIRITKNNDVYTFQGFFDEKEFRNPLFPMSKSKSFILTNFDQRLGNELTPNFNIDDIEKLRHCINDYLYYNRIMD